MTTKSTPQPQQSLSAKTAQYWEVSSILYGRLAKKISTGAAIDKTGKLLAQLGPDRPLQASVARLHNCIVYGGTKKNPPLKFTNILKLPERQAQ